MASKNILINSLKMILMSSGALFIAILLSLSLPNLLNSVPSLWSSIRTWLRPPYLHVIINGIIITIAASSRLLFHHRAPPRMEVPYGGSEHHSAPHGAVSVRDIAVDHHDVGSSFSGVASVKDVEVDEVSNLMEKENSSVDEDVKDVMEYTDISAEREESKVVKKSTWTAQDSLHRFPEFSPERPPRSSRFGHRRRPVKTSPAHEGGNNVLRIAKPWKYETLESVWKAITEQRHLPEVKNSEKFKDRTNYSPPPVTSSKLKEEPSLSQDELNRRAEAFINKFNQDMRLERQQSVQQYMEMINHAA